MILCLYLGLSKETVIPIRVYDYKHGGKRILPWQDRGLYNYVIYYKFVNWPSKILMLVISF